MCKRSHALSKFMKTLYQKGRGRHLIIADQLWPDSDRTQTPPLNTRDVETTNASPQRRSCAAPNASTERGKSVNATRPLQHLIKALTKTHVCFYTACLAKNE